MENEKPWVDYVLEICAGINHFEVEGVKVFIAMNDMEYPADSHKHNDIEFMCVKRQTLTDVLCNDTVVTIPKNYILPFMPMQNHGCAKPMIIHQYIGIAFPPEFFNKYIGEIDGFDLNFRNIPFPASHRFDYLVGYLAESHAHGKSQKVLINILELIFVELCYDYLNFIGEKTQSDSGLTKARTYLDRHIFLPFNLIETAAVANISKYYFCRLFKEEYGLTPREYLLTKKIEYAKRQIAETGRTFTDIALELKFDSLAHFSTQFLRLTEISPGEFKKTLIK